MPHGLSCSTDISYFLLFWLLASVAASVGIHAFGQTTRTTEDGDDEELAPAPAPAPAPGIPSDHYWLTYRDPIAVWLNSTYAGVTEPPEPIPEAWCATCSIECETADQCLQVLRRLQQGIELDLGGGDGHDVGPSVTGGAGTTLKAGAKLLVRRIFGSSEGEAGRGGSRPLPAP